MNKWDAMSDNQRAAWFVVNVYRIRLFTSWGAYNRSKDVPARWAVFDRARVGDSDDPPVRVYGALSDGCAYNPSQDRDMAALLEAKIREQILGSRYAQFLWHLMFPTDDFSWEKVFAVVAAPPHLRAEAAFLSLTSNNIPQPKGQE